MRHEVVARLTAAGEKLPSTVGITVMGGSEAMSTELALLVLSGRKTATSSLAWEYDWEGSPLRRAGDEDILADFCSTPFALIRTISVQVVPFELVGADFAAAEGEGDGTLESWRREHWRFFSLVCAKIGKEADPRMPVVCERFQIVKRFETGD